MGIGDTIAPNSDQLDAVDLVAGPRTFTVDSVTVQGGAEQPVNIHLAEFDRPWRPGKSMRRVLVAIWGDDESAYAGRRLTLWCDPRVKFGGDAVGGVRITHMSHLDKPRGVPLIVSRGKSGVYPVKPLVEAAPAPQPYTPDHERVIGEHIKRTGLSGKEVLDTARAIAGRDLKTARDLTAAEADELITTLAEVPDAEAEGEQA